MPQTVDTLGGHLDTMMALGTCLVANQPVMLMGPPGQGKSVTVEQLSSDLDLWLETVIASNREPTDFGGTPYVDPTTGALALGDVVWARRMVDNLTPNGGVAFFDEINTAPETTQAAMLRVVQERWVGDLRLPDSVRIIAAANPTDQAAGGWELAAPMANRFTHLTWRLPAAVVQAGFTVGWPTITVPQVDPDAARAALVEAKALIGGFIGAHQELVTRLPKVVGAGTYAYPTPRSWEAAARLYAVAIAANLNETVVNLLLSGTVGSAAATEFLQYAAHLDLPDPEGLLANPSSLALDPRRLDRTYVIAASVVTAVANNPTVERWTACGDVLAGIAAAGAADIAYVYVRTWAANRVPGAVPGPLVATHLTPVLTEIGLLG